MTNINNEYTNLEEFLKFFSETYLASNPRYDGSKLTLEFKSNFPKAKSIIESIFVDFSVLVGNSIEIKLSSLNIANASIFYGTADFLQKYERIKDNFDSCDIFLIESSGSHSIKKANDNFNSKNSLILNIREYNETLIYLLSIPEFTPYVSEIDNQFTLISKAHGVFTIGYDLPETAFFQALNLNGLLSKFQKNFDKKEFVQFFKEIVITAIHNTPQQHRYNEIIKQHDSLLNLAKRDYETYVSNFAFDKIKSEFKEEREKYFNTIDNNIGSIGKQVISFPLTFGATIFASYKVKDQPEFLLLILFAYFLYTIIAFLILNMTAYNVKCLRKDVEAEEKIIKTSYKVIYDGFKEDFKKIKHKILNLRIVIGVLYFVLVALLILFAIFTFYYINTENLIPNDSITNTLYIGLDFVH